MNGDLGTGGERSDVTKREIKRTFVNLISVSGRFLLLTGTRSMASSVESAPSITFPKIVYFPSRCGCLAYVMKNWDLLLSGPVLAIATTPRALNWRQVIK